MIWLAAALLLCLIANLQLRVMKLERGEERQEEENKEEKAWNEGVSSIVAYDLARAREAARND